MDDIDDVDVDKGNDVTKTDDEIGGKDDDVDEEMTVTVFSSKNGRGDVVVVVEFTIGIGDEVVNGDLG